VDQAAGYKLRTTQRYINTSQHYGTSALVFTDAVIWSLKLCLRPEKHSYTLATFGRKTRIFGRSWISTGLVLFAFARSQRWAERLFWV